MHRFISKMLFLILILFSSGEIAGESFLKRHEVSIGPQWSYLKRTKSGGSKQTGNLYGVYANYDRLVRYSWYWGGDIQYSLGTLRGRTAMGDKMTSHFSQFCAEARIGYTFQQKESYQIAFTPFIGGGYIIEKNNFTKSSPLPIHFKIPYSFATAGFLAGARISDCWEAGVNFKARLPFDPHCHVSNDPENDPVKQRIGERVFYRVDIPIVYHAFCNPNMMVVLNPFFESRRYGKHVNFPFDFYETKLNFYGIILEWQYRL